MTKKAIVIGAGIAGIASSIRLQHKGYEVTVLEKNSYLGGKLSKIEQDHFSFDAGPSLLTMPYLIDELHALGGHKSQEVFEYAQLDIACQYFFHDGTKLTAFADEKKRLREFKEKLGIDPKLLNKYLNKTKYIWNVTAPIFLYKSLHQIKTFLSLDTLWRALQLPFIGINNTMAKYNRKKLNNPKAEQYFNRFATYNGSNPYVAPATLNVVAFLEHFEGAYYPKESMISINRSLVNTAMDLGVTFLTNQNAEEIVIENGRAIGVQSNGVFQSADLVISNCDVYNTYKNLLPKNPIPKSIKQQERSSSALIFYWGINRTFENLDAHNILFSKDYEKEFQQIWEEQKVPNDPTVYINISSKYNPKDAPEGCENWFVMINVPSNLEIDWEKNSSAYRSSIIDRINTALQTDIEKHIVTENMLTPQGIQDKTASHLGALYGSASNEKLAAFFRHSNKMKVADNLYAVGGSVHPGGGIPLCLLSARITAEMIEKA